MTIQVPGISSETLAHYGIKGMQWGIRRDPRNVASRAADKASAAKARAKQNADIDAARRRVNSGQTRQDLKTAKRVFKTEKKTLGRREARKNLHSARLKAHTEVEKAQMIKSGGETAAALLGFIGGTVLSEVLRK